MIIGNYVIGKVLGRGKYGWVSRAKHLKLDIKVALKHAPWAIGEQCDGGISHDECDHVKESSWRAALHNEAMVLGGISHPAIVSLLEVLTGPYDSIYICLEDLGNTSLTNFVEIKGNPGLNEEIARKIMKDLSEGLNHLHKVGILHRDLKPDNVMVISCLDKVSAKLIDLGLSAPWSPDKMLSTSDVRAGTVAYMAPELMVERTKYGSQIDVFSLGATLYYSLVGEAPFNEFVRNRIKLTTSIFGLQITHEDAFGDMSHNAANLIQSMLVSDPDKRCSLASLFVHPWINSLQP